MNSSQTPYVVGSKGFWFGVNTANSGCLAVSCSQFVRSLDFSTSEKMISQDLRMDFKDVEAIERGFAAPASVPSVQQHKVLLIILGYCVVRQTALQVFLSKGGGAVSVHSEDRSSEAGCVYVAFAPAMGMEGSRMPSRCGSDTKASRCECV